MIKVTIVSDAIRTMEGIGKTSGKPYKLAFQEAYFHTIGRDGVKAPFPQKVEIFAPKDANGNVTPFAVGEYEMAPSSVYVDRNGKLAVEPHLVALKPSAAARPTQS